MEDENEKALSLVSDVSYSLCPIILFCERKCFHVTAQVLTRAAAAAAAARVKR